MWYNYIVRSIAISIVIVLAYLFCCAAIGIVLLIMSCGASQDTMSSVDVLARSVATIDDDVVARYLESDCEETTDVDRLEQCVDALQASSNDVAHLRSIAMRVMSDVRTMRQPSCQDIRDAQLILAKHDANPSSIDHLLSICAE